MPETPRMIQHVVLHRMEFTYNKPPMDVADVLTRHLTPGAKIDYSNCWTDAKTGLEHLYLIWSEPPVINENAKPAQQAQRPSKVTNHV